VGGGGQPLYGFGALEPLRFSRAEGHSDVFYLQDRELDIDEVGVPPPRPCACWSSGGNNCNASAQRSHAQAVSARVYSEQALLVLK
jgi:hypothetical protein